jgi:hypothetical protein
MCDRNFQIFYSDGPAPKNAIPTARGVQAIVQDNDDVGSELVASSDYYVKINGRWKGVDIFGLFDFLLDSGVVLFGRIIQNKEYQKLVKEAIKTKETWLPGEKKFR